MTTFQVNSYYLGLSFVVAALAYKHECTYESCPICLDEAINSSENLSVTAAGQTYSVPLRIGRCLEYWDSQALMSQFVGILAREKLGINIEYVNIFDEVEAWYALNNCRGWKAMQCDKVVRSSDDAIAAHNASQKTAPDPVPDVMYVPEMALDFCCVEEYFTNTDIVWLAKEARGLGKVGYISENRIYLFKETVHSAWEKSGDLLELWRTYTQPLALKHFDSLDSLVKDGLIIHEVPCCDGTCAEASPIFKSGAAELIKMGWSCLDGWWLSPACAALGDWKQECYPMLDDSFGYFKPKLFKAIAELDLRVAKANVGYDLFYELIYDKTINVLFFWWTTDSQFTVREPATVNMPAEKEQEQFILMDKAGWQPVLEPNEQLSTLLTNIMLKNAELDALMSAVVNAQSLDHWSGVETGPALYQKLACDFLRQNRQTWETSWLPDVRSCLSGNFYNATVLACQPCPGGSYSYRDPSDGIPRCNACPKGSYCPEKSSTPTPCSPGFFTSDAGAEECSACPKGTYQNETGQTECVICGKLKTTKPDCNRVTIDDCTCDIGTYVHEDSCKPCPARSTTLQVGSNFDSCLCDQGFFMSGGTPDSSFCKPCLDGMVCARGSTALVPPENYSFPQLEPGFYASFDEPLSVYRCGRKENCPGGPPGYCGAGLIGRTCTVCPDGLYFERGECRACGQRGGVGIILVISSAATLILVLCPMHMAINRPFLASSQQIMIAALFGSMAVTTILTFGVYGTVSAVWTPPISDLFSFLSFLRFDLEVFNMSCMATLGYSARYAIKLLAYPIVCVALCVAIACVHICPRTRPYSYLNIPALQNSCGFLMSAFFVSVSIVSLEGFNCWQNPNGKETLIVETPVICWEGQHFVLFILSIIAVMTYSVGFLALTLYISLRYAALSVKYGATFTTRVRFLSARMRPDCILMSYAFNLRSFWISVAPVIASSSYGIQIGLLMVSFLLWLVVQEHTQCWRFRVLNVADACVSCGQVILLFLFTLAGAEPTTVEKATVGWCIVVMIATMIAMMALAAMYKTVSYLYQKKHYDVFISHHKAAADIYARHLSTLLERPGKVRPFLDVDQLENLDNLVFAVKNSRRLLLLLTSDVLRRPWCSVEVVSAWLNGVPILVGQVNDDVVELNLETIDELINCFQAKDWNILSKQGVSKNMVRNAYTHVAGLPKMKLTLNSMNVEKQATLATSVLGMGKYSPPVYAVDPEKRVHLIYNTLDNIQCSSAYILKILLCRHGWNVLSLDALPEDASDDADTGIVVVMVSKGLITNPVALANLVACRRKALRMLSVLTKEQFWRPGQTIMRSFRDGNVLNQADFKAMDGALQSLSLDEVASALEATYQILALHFQPEVAQSIMLEELRIIEQRAFHELQKGKQRRSRVNELPAADTMESVDTVTSVNSEKELRSLRTTQNISQLGSGNERKREERLYVKEAL